MRRPALRLLALLAVLSGCGTTDPDPCKDVDCGAGHCAVANGVAECVCDPGFERDALSCVAVSPPTEDACAGDPCVGTGKPCTADGGVAVCSCPEGFVDSVGGCVTADPCSPNPCALRNQTVCVAQGQAVTCLCDPGFAPAGTGCETEPRWSCADQHSDAGDDSYEPDECPTLAKALPFDETQQRSIFGPGDDDWLVLTPTAANRIIEVKLNGAAGLGLYVDVYLKDGLTGIAGDHRGSNIASFSFATPVAETLLLRVRALKGSATGSYSVLAKEVGTDDFPNSHLQASALSAGALFSGAVQYAGDADWVRIDVPALTAYRLTLGPGGLGAAVQVYEADGTTLRKSLDLTSLENRTRYLWSKAGATYYLRAGSLVAGAYPFSYSVTVENAGPDDFGDDDGDATLVLPSGTMQAGLSHRSDDLDVIRFAVEPGHAYSVSCKGVWSSPCVASLRTGYGAVIGSGTWPSQFAAAAATEAGQWTAAFHEAAGLSYSFSISDLGLDDHGDTVAMATDAALGSNAGFFGGLSDVDYLKFTTTADHVYEVKCYAQAPLAGCATKVIGPNGAVVGATTNYVDQLIGFKANGGVYSIEVTAGASTLPGAYTIFITDKGTDDYGDAPAAANALTLGTARTGTLEHPKDVDFFTFTAQQGRAYQVIVSTGTSTPRFTIFDPSNLTVFSEGPSPVAFKATTSGTFTIRVGSTAETYTPGYTGVYGVTVTDLGVDDYGDSLGTATPISLGTTVSGALTFGADKDYFQFSGTAGRIYRVRAQVSSGEAQVALMNSASATLAFAYTVAPPDPSVLGALLTTSGTYAVQVSSAGFPFKLTNYSVTVTDEGPDDHGNTAQTATPIVAGAAAASGATQYPNDVDVFSFSAVQGRIYRFSCSAPVNDTCALRAKNSSGAVVISAPRGTQTEVIFSAAASANYTVEVFSDLGGTPSSGAYSYRLYDDGSDDHGNTASTATAIAFGTTQSGSIQYPNDVDAFSLTTVTGRSYRFVCTNSSTGCSLTLRDSAGNAVRSSSGGPTVTLALEETFGRPYSLEVRETNPFAGASNYSFTSEEFVDDVGDTFGTSDQLTLGTTKSGTLELADQDIDVFRISLTAGMPVSIQLASPGSLRFNLHASDGSFIADWWGAQQQPYAFTPPSSGTYYVRVMLYSGAAVATPYTLLVQ